MSFTEDQARKKALINAGEDAASRTFAHDPGEGEAWWWFGLLSTIRATGEQTGGRYTLVAQGCSSRLHSGLRAGEAVVRPFACRL